MLAGGTGNDVLTGNGGLDTFVFADGTGTDRIIDFDTASGDQINLGAVTGMNSFAEVQAASAIFVSRHTRINLPDGGRILILNVLPGELSTDDFSFTAPPSPATASASRNAADGQLSLHGLATSHPPGPHFPHIGDDDFILGHGFSSRLFLESGIGLVSSDLADLPNAEDAEFANEPQLDTRDSFVQSEVHLLEDAALEQSDGRDPHGDDFILTDASPASSDFKFSGGAVRPAAIQRQFDGDLPEDLFSGSGTPVREKPMEPITDWEMDQGRDFITDALAEFRTGDLDDFIL